ncbi:hypothetical protein [Streptomyces sp. NPDC005167]
MRMPPVTPAELREAISGTLALHVKSYDLAAACVHLGLAPQQSGEDPFTSKRLYVRARLQDKKLPELTALARQVISEYGDDDLRRLYERLGLLGVDGEFRNLIFAADGPKPRIVLPDSVGNTIRIVENERFCLVYDEPLKDQGLTWSDLLAWWQRHHSQDAADPSRARITLHDRLRRSLGDNGAEQLVFDTYVKLGFDLPALIPQVYLHYDPYTARELNGLTALGRQRMDFLLLMNNRARAVIEVDGRQHYAGPDGRADTAAYAAMMIEDRELTLQGYEVYRIGGHDLTNHTSAEAMLTDLFTRLLHRHGHHIP